MMACPICLQLIDDKDQLLLRCSHLYHRSCISSWIESKEKTQKIPDCPLCRAEIDANYLLYILIDWKEHISYDKFLEYHVGKEKIHAQLKRVVELREAVKRGERVETITLTRRVFREAPLPVPEETVSSPSTEGLLQLVSYGPGLRTSRRVLRISSGMGGLAFS